MKCLTINKCCCGCSLRKGSIVIGLFLAVISLLTTVSVGSMAEHFAKEKGEVDGEVAIYIVATVAWVCFTIANLLVIVGATQEITCLLILWMVSTTINLLIYAGLYAYVVYVIIDSNSGALGVVMTILIDLAIICMFSYCILVVYNYYLRIVSSRAVIEQPPSQPDPNARRWR